MSVTCRMSSTVTTDGAGSLSGSGSETGVVAMRIDEFLASGTVRGPVSIAFAAAALQFSYLVADQDMTVETNGTNEVQTLSTTGTVTAGTFTITFSGQTTGAIAWNATAAAVQAALEALSNVAVGDVAATGGPLPATPVVVTFTGNLGNQNVAAMTTTDTLTGGSTAVATTTGGVAPTNTFALKAGRELAWRKSDGYFANPYTADVTKFSITCATAARLRGRVLTS
jgi:hypothetical protein